MTIEIQDNASDLQVAEVMALAIMRMEREGNGWSRKAALAREVGRLVEVMERMEPRRLAKLYQGL